MSMWWGELPPFDERTAAPMPDMGTADASAGVGGNMSQSMYPTDQSMIPSYRDHGGEGPSSGPDTGGSLMPSTQNLQKDLSQKFPGTEMGGYRPPDPNGMTEHSSGQALDITNTDPYKAQDIMEEAFKNPDTNFVLWDGEQYNPDGTHGKMPDRGNPTENHADHLHINVGMRLAFDPGGHKVPQLEETRLPINPLATEDFGSHPAVQGFQDFYDAELDPPPPAEALADYLSTIAPHHRIHYNLLQRFIGEPETDTYPYGGSDHPMSGGPRQPYAEVRYPAGYELDADDPHPGFHYAMGMPTPEGLTFRHEDWIKEAPMVTAVLNGEDIGRISWWAGKKYPEDRGEIVSAVVAEPWRHHGIATALFDYIQQNHEPNLRHSESLTDDGRAWSKWEQRTREKRHRKVAMPLEDAYDPRAHLNYDGDYIPPENVQPIKNHTGRWYHISVHDLPVGTRLLPAGGETPFGYSDTNQWSSLPKERKDWVWFDTKVKARKWMKDVYRHMKDVHLYEVVPETDDGPWPYNGSGENGHVAKGARIVRKIPTTKNQHWPHDVEINFEPEDRRKIRPGDYEDLGKAAAKVAMPQPVPEHVTFHYHDTDAEIPMLDPDDHTRWLNLPPESPIRDLYGPDMLRFRAPAIEARQHGQYIGHVQWDPATKTVKMISVDAPHRHRSVATTLFDLAREREPELQHAQTTTNPGRHWEDYERGRGKAPAAKVASAYPAHIYPHLYRGICLDEGTPPPSPELIKKLKQIARRNPHRVGDQSDLGDQLLDHLLTAGPMSNWSVREDVADHFASWPSAGQPWLEVKLHARNPGDEHQHDVDSMFGDEHEVRFAPGTTMPVHGIDIRIPGATNWVGLWPNEPRHIKVAMPVGPLPKMVIRHRKDDGNQWVQALSAETNHLLGELAWHPDGEIAWVHVLPEFRRRGLAKAMLEHAREHHQPDIHHSDLLSEDGAAWARKVAMPMPTPEGLVLTPFQLDDAISKEVSKATNMFWRPGPGVAAYHNGKPIGHIEWYSEQDVESVAISGNPGKVKHGEIAFININPEYRRHGIATALFDYARSVEPKVHHSDLRTSLGKEWVGYEESRTRAARIAMPQSTPKGLNFKYHGDLDSLLNTLPNLRDSYVGASYDSTVLDTPCVTAHLGDDPNPVGSITWYTRDHPEVANAQPTDLPAVTPGEVKFINVHPDLRRHGIATAMFDWAQDVVPDLHHSPERTPLGRLWIPYEESRHQKAAGTDVLERPADVDLEELMRSPGTMRVRRNKEPSTEPQVRGSGEDPEELLSKWEVHRDKTIAPEDHDKVVKRGRPGRPDAGPARGIGVWGNRLEEALYKEFMDWWPTSEASRTRKPRDSGTNWVYYPHEPAAHWLNVEDFLRERHPDAATGSEYGQEHAAPMLSHLAEDYVFTPEDLKDMGYDGQGNVITQAMLNLHNRIQERPFIDDPLQRERYYKLMLRHVGPGAVRRTASIGNALIGFLMWVIRNHDPVNRESLAQYAQQSDITLEEYIDLGRFLDEGLLSEELQ